MQFPLVILKEKCLHLHFVSKRVYCIYKQKISKQKSIQKVLTKKKKKFKEKKSKFLASVHRNSTFYKQLLLKTSQ